MTRRTRRQRTLVTLASSLVLVLAGCSPDAPPPDAASPDFHVSDPTPDTGAVINLIQQDWQHTPGVTVDGGELQVASTGGSVIERGEGRVQRNPPLNLAGTHLEAVTDFSVSVSFTEVTADASLTLYDSPPIIADEFRIEPASVRLTVRDDTLEVVVLDGAPVEVLNSSEPTHREHLTLSDAGAAFSVRRSGDTLEIISGGDTLSSLSLGGIFTSTELWLGLSSNDGSFTVSSFTAAPLGGATLATAGPAVVRAGQSNGGLQALASRIRPGFRIGAAVALGPLSSDEDYGRQLVGNFGALTPENAMKPQFLSPQRGVHTFEEIDAILEIAEAKGMAVHGHTIAFTEAMPRWMQELPADSDAERSSSAAALLDYVTTVVTHFKGRLDSLDVVNEPFDVSEGTDLQHNIWYRVFGPGYPAIVSQAVHDADPDVKQFINENGADVPGERQDALLELALETNALGGHIYGVGLQAHVYDLDDDAISADDLSETLSLFEEAGLHVRISENDVTDDQGVDAQAEQYAAVLSTCLNSPACVSYTTWGVDDRYDWWVDDDGSLQQGHDFLFDQGKPTPAYEAMREVLTD